ncbi:MAG: Stage V sporulation protein D, partial [Parcubacteria group bacterium GW2011_GWA2_56_7]
PVTFKSYEPGSVFKPITMAAALDRGAVSPSSTFVDTGSITVGPFTIKNSDGKAHGEATMTEVLEQSLNTGVVHVLGELGNDAFRAYVKAFGFGERVGLPLDTEAAGNISSLDRDGDVYAITASYGQGITVTPIQLAQAYATFANEGVMVRPRLVKELRYPDGVVRPVEVDVRGRVISKKAARLLNAMLVSVVESGHARRAGV